MFSLIACVGKNRELGRSGELVFRIREDMKFFRETTKGHRVVMGRKTWESLPGKLPGRVNIVISHGEVEGADQVIHDYETFATQNTDTKEEIFIIGGGAIYEMFLPYARCLYLTEVDAECADADTFFPEFDKSRYEREVISRGDEGGLNYSIVKYIKKGGL